MAKKQAKIVLQLSIFLLSLDAWVKAFKYSVYLKNIYFHKMSFCLLWVATIRWMI